MCVPKCIPNRHSKTVAREYQRHVRNHNGLRCCKDKKNEQHHAEQTQSTEQVPRCRHHEGLEQLKQNLDVCKRKEYHKHVRSNAQGRTRRATTTIVCQTHGLVHMVPASGVATIPTASMVKVERNIKAERLLSQWQESCDGLRRNLRGPAEVCKYRARERGPRRCALRANAQECAGRVLKKGLPLARTDTGTDTNTG